MEFQEFIYHNESERQFLEDEAIYSLILKMFQQIKEDDMLLNHKLKGDLFNKQIAFELQKMLRPPFTNENGEETYIPLPQYGCSHCGQLYFTKE